MKKGRISKEEEKFIKENIVLGYERLATELDRDPDSVLGFIRKKGRKKRKLMKKKLPRETFLFHLGWMM